MKPLLLTYPPDRRGLEVTGPIFEPCYTSADQPLDWRTAIGAHLFLYRLHGDECCLQVRRPSANHPADRYDEHTTSIVFRRGRVQWRAAHSIARILSGAQPRRWALIDAATLSAVDAIDLSPELVNNVRILERRDGRPGSRIRSPHAGTNLSGLRHRENVI